MKILSISLASTAILVFSLVTGAAHAQAGHAAHHHGHAPSAASGAAMAAQLSEGTVRRVNPEQGVVTIAHGPLVTLDMPPMTMTFRVSGEASLEGLSSGDKIRFAADKEGDEFVVTAIEKLVK